MAHNGVMVFGLGLLVLAGIMYFAPFYPEAYTIPQTNAFCESAGLSNERDCIGVKYLTQVIYIIVILGIIVLAIGWFLDAPKKEDKPKQVETSLEILKERYAKGEISKEEFENMKKDLENS